LGGREGVSNLLLIKELSKIFFHYANASFVILGMTKRSQMKDYDNEGGKEDMELMLFDLAEIAKATEIFSKNNKLGEGGFGPVYKVN
jgi:hypothetical protein